MLCYAQYILFLERSIIVYQLITATTDQKYNRIRSKCNNIINDWSNMGLDYSDKMFFWGCSIVYFILVAAYVCNACFILKLLPLFNKTNPSKSTLLNIADDVWLHEIAHNCFSICRWSIPDKLNCWIGLAHTTTQNPQLIDY